MPILRLWRRVSRGRRLNIKRLICFPVIVYAVYFFIDSFMPVFMVGFVILLLYTGLVKAGFGDELLLTTRST